MLPSQYEKKIKRLKDVIEKLEERIKHLQQQRVKLIELVETLINRD